jgi:hypothetical protein
MDDFFTPPPRPPHEPEPRYRSPAWIGPPSGTLPGVVELETVLARTDEVAVCLRGVFAYPTGLSFDVVTMGGPDAAELDLDPHSMMLHRHRHRHRHRRHTGRGRDEELPPEMLRFGLEFADGTRVTNVGNDPWLAMADAGDEDDDSFTPRAPTLTEHGGGGGGTDWEQSYWLWPLPPPGRLTVVCEWPVARIPVTRVELDTAPIHAAAARAQVVFEFPERPDDDDGMRHSFTIVRD